MTTLLELSKLKPGGSFKYCQKTLKVKWIDFLHDEENKWLCIAVEPNNQKICGFSFGYPDLNLKIKDFEV